MNAGRSSTGGSVVAATGKTLSGCSAAGAPDWPSVSSSATTTVGQGTDGSSSAVPICFGSTSTAAAASSAAGRPVVGREAGSGVAMGVSPPTSCPRGGSLIFTGSTARATGADSACRSPVLATARGSFATTAAASVTARPPVISPEAGRGVASSASPPAWWSRRRGLILSGGTVRAASADSERRSPVVATSSTSGSTATAATASFTAASPVFGGEGERGVATGASLPTSRRRRRGRTLTGDTASAIGADSARRSPMVATFRGSISWFTAAATSSTAGPLGNGEEVVRGVASAAAAAGTAARRPRRRTGGSTSTGGLGDRAATTCPSSGVTVTAVSATTKALSGG